MGLSQAGNAMAVCCITDSGDSRVLQDRNCPLNQTNLHKSDTISAKYAMTSGQIKITSAAVALPHYE
jgi:hypothetical protein